MKILDISWFNYCCNAIQRDFYNPVLPLTKQSEGYRQLLTMAINEDRPATPEENTLWENSISLAIILYPAKNKYLQFLHPLLRPYIRENWDKIIKYTKRSTSEIPNVQLLINKLTNNE